MSQRLPHRWAICRSSAGHVCALIEAIRKPHCEVVLPREDFIKLATWVDANAPYYGSYFGRRSLAHRNAPDFRVVPTLQVALGLR